MSACTYCGRDTCEGECDMGEEDDEVCEKCGDHKDNCHCARDVPDDDGEPDEPEFDPDAADNEADRHFAQGRE